MTTDEPNGADANAAGETDAASAAVSAAASGKLAAKKAVAKKPPLKAASTANLINKLLAILTRRLEMMEKRSTAAEKEIPQMASMTKTIDQLIEMQKAEKASKAKPVPKRTTKELDELRKKIAERIDELYRD